MNKNWLDILAREFGTAATRRGAMRLLIGGVPAVFLGLNAARDAAAACIKPNKKIRKGKKCCPGTKKKKGRCRCIEGTACGSICCTGGKVCLPTVSGGQACDFPDQNPGQVCNSEVPASCASGICGCGPGGCTCREETCAAAGESCNSNSDCCDSLCYALKGYICGPLP